VLVLQPISMVRRWLPALELLHRIEGKVVEETGAQVWTRGKLDEKRGTERWPVDFLAAQGREGKRGGGGVGTAMWRRRRREEGGGLAWRSAVQGGRPRPPAVGRGRLRCRTNREGGGHGRRGVGR
jgi:hypothetical protein